MSELGDTALGLFEPVEAAQPPVEAYDHLFSDTAGREPVSPADSVFFRAPELVPAERLCYLSNIDGIPDDTPAIEISDEAGRKKYKYFADDGSLVDVPQQNPNSSTPSIKVDYREGALAARVETVDGVDMQDHEAAMMAGFLQNIVNRLHPGAAQMHAVSAEQAQANVSATVGAASIGKTPIALGSAENATSHNTENQESLARRMQGRYKDMDPSTKDRLRRIGVKVLSCWMVCDVIFIGGSTVVDVAQHKAGAAMHNVSFGLIDEPSKHYPYALTSDVKKDAVEIIGGPILAIKTLSGK
jgi:hypothetical protein